MSVKTNVHLAEAAVLLGILALAGVYAASAGHFTRHMVLHIGMMTVLAPLLASVFLGRWQCSWSAAPGFLAGVTIAQLALFFAWHTPPAMGRAMAVPVAGALMQISLLVVACCFWLSVFRHAGSRAWSAVLALLLTGKLFCLLALILVFAPRVLYKSHHTAIALADQQLAGLLMITLCPLTYVLAAVILVVRWLRVLDEAPARERRG